MNDEAYMHEINRLEGERDHYKRRERQLTDECERRDRLLSESEATIKRLRTIMSDFLWFRLLLEKATEDLSEGQLLPQHAIYYRDKMREAVRAMGDEAEAIRG